MRKRELQRGRGQRHLVALTHNRNPTRLFNQVSRRSLVIMGRMIGHITREDAGIVRPANDHADIMRFGIGQKRIQRALFKQGVAPGQQHAVEIAGLGKAQTHIRFIQATANGANHPGATQFIKRTITTIHQGAKTLFKQVSVLDGPEINVMDQQYIHA